MSSRNAAPSWWGGALRDDTKNGCVAEKKKVVHSFKENVVFPAQAEYSYCSAAFRLKIFLHYS